MMKNLLPANASPLNSIITLAVAVFLVTACGIFSGGNRNSGGSRSANSNSRDPGATGWKVWVKTDPCAGGRTDWIAVAKENPTFGGGGSFWQTADLIENPLPCTLDDSCTFASAMQAADRIRASSRFTNYCCRSYSVWRNSETGKMAVVEGKFSTAGFGWMLEKANLCCEEAESLSGITGACRGRTTANSPPGGPTPPPLGPTPAITPGAGGGRSCWDCVNKEEYCKQECSMAETYGVPPSFGDQCEPKGFGEKCRLCWESKCRGTLYPNR